VAEGIERESQLEALMAMGAQFGQGWLFGAPIPPARSLGRSSDAVSEL
jgi:sensor c-di-GMP phosphodiesterase-like protein